MRIRILLIVWTSLLSFASAQPLGAQAPKLTDFERDNLAGITAVSITVEDLNSALRDCGLQANSIKQIILRQLLNAGIKVIESGKPYLHVGINGLLSSPGLCVANLDVSAYTYAYAKMEHQQTGAAVFTEARFWDRGKLLTGPPTDFAERVGNSLSAFVDEFATKVRLANGLAAVTSNNSNITPVPNTEINAPATDPSPVLNAATPKPETPRFVVGRRDPCVVETEKDLGAAVMVTFTNVCDHDIYFVYTQSTVFGDFDSWGTNILTPELGKGPSHALGRFPEFTIHKPANMEAFCHNGHLTKRPSAKQDRPFNVNDVICEPYNSPAG